MGLFDLFSNDTAEQAAAQRNAGLQQGYDALSSSYGQGRDSLTSNLAQGGNALTGALGQGRDALSYNLGQGSGALTGALGQGRDALSTSYGQGRDALNTNFNNASNLWGGLLNSSNAGANAYGDASGANGVAGLQKATDTFKNSGQYGAYGFSLGQGLQALDRTHAAAGNLSSGNADADTLKYATGLAGQQYGNYVSGLQPYLGQQNSAVAGAAGVNTGLGSAINQSYDNQGNAINANYGAQGAGVNANYGTLGTGLNANYGAQGAGLNANYGAQGAGLNQSYQGQGGAANSNYTGQGASNAAATMNNYNVGANQLGAIMGVANLAAGGMGGGLTGGLGGLFGGFGGSGGSGSGDGSWYGQSSVGGKPLS